MGAESGLRRRVKGLSEAEFRARFGTETQCRAAVQLALGGPGPPPRPETDEPRCG